MADHLGKSVEGGLASEGAQFDAPVLTQTSSRTHVDAQGAVTKSDHGHEAVAGEKTGEDVEKGSTTTPPVDESGLLTGFRLYAVFGALMLGVFLFALDQSIVATAIPIFTSEFNAFAEVGWTITGYFLTQCGLILFVGQLLTIVKAKWVLLIAFFFFELGSLIAGVAKSMNVLIAGRAIQGVGTSGMFSSMMLIITVITRVEQRSAFMASFGFVFVISSICGPLLGGVFTEHVTWRWCFYINLPIGGLAAAAVFFLLPAREPTITEANRGKTKWQQFKQLDFLGTLMILGIIVCLLLALSDGGNKYAWSNWRIIFEFVLAGILIIAFAFWQVYLGERALIPTTVLKNRTQISASIAIFMTMLVMLAVTYQLPLYYEAVKNHSPTKAGIDIIPAMLATCIAIFISGGVTTGTGRYYPWLLLGPPFAGVGVGLLSTVNPDTSNARLIGYQILAGVGIGFSFQQIILAIQVEWHDRPQYMAQAVGVGNFFQLTGAAIGVGIVNTVQSVYLNKELRARAPDVPFEVVRQSVTAIWTSVDEDKRAGVIDAYVQAITQSFIPVYIAVAIAFVASIFIRNHNVKAVGGGAVMAA